jgi:hypothetical protein
MSGERGMNSERRWARKKSKRVKPLNIDECRVGTEPMRINSKVFHSEVLARDLRKIHLAGRMAAASSMLRVTRQPQQ